MKLQGVLSTLMLTASGLIGQAVALKQTTKPMYCFVACQAAFLTAEFAGKKGACTNPNRVSSLYVCARTYCTEEEFQAGLEGTNKYCEQVGSSWPSPHVIDNITQADVAKLPRLTFADLPPLEKINRTTIPDEDLWKIGYTTVSQFYDVRITHLWYSYAQFIFWGVVLAGGVLLNAMNAMRSFSLDISSEPSPPTRKSNILGRLWTQIRAHFLLPALGSKRCAEPILWGQGTLAPRGESFIIVAFIIINVVLSAVNLPASEQNLYEVTVTLQTLRYLADRSGYLAFANLSIFWFFGIRNNILIYLTGWSFDAFNHFHRWVARVGVLHAVIHGFTYTAYSVLESPDDLQEQWTEQYWYCGAIAVICMSLMIGFSFRFFRVRWYDLFLLVHILLSLVVLVTLFFHVKIFTGEYDGFLWACVAFWVFDRVLRVARVVYSALRARSNYARGEYSPEEDLVRLDVTDMLADRKPSSLSFFFLYSWRTMPPWESHPFTLVRYETSSAATSDSDSPSTPTSPTSPTDSKEMHLSMQSRTSSSTGSFIPNSNAGTHVHYTFLIRPCKGFTSRLRALISPSQTTSIPLLLEGPYSAAPPNLARFSDILIIAGGSGIAVGITAAYDALRHGRPDARIRLLWTARSAALIRGVANRELKHALCCDRVVASLHVTGRSDVPHVKARDVAEAPGTIVVAGEAGASRRGSAIGKADEAQKAGDEAEKEEEEVIALHHGRPDLQATIAEAFERRSGPLGVVACGPGNMMDDVRRGFAQRLGMDKCAGEDCQLLLESFGW